MKDKESIIFGLESSHGTDDMGGVSLYFEGIKEAMDIWAKEISIAFDEWKRKEKIYHGLFTTDNGKWYYSTGEIAAESSDKLYDMFQEHLNKSKENGNQSNT